MDFLKIPKIELHLHLDCSLSYKVVSRINPVISYAEYQENFIAPAKCTNLADFLARTSSGIALMQTEEHLRLVTLDLFEQLAADGVIYAEVRFAPLQHTEKGLSAGEVVAIVEATVAQAIRETGIEVRLLLCTLRHYTEAQSLETVKLVEQFRGTTVVGFDIAGDEAGFPIAAHLAAFQYAIDQHLPRTAHAGEAGGPQSVRETLHNFRPSRIGHGVRSIEDPELIEYLNQQRIHLEVCPGSNLQTAIYPDYSDHPVDRLYRAGISLGLSTDARTLSNISLSQEYEHIQDTFGWGKAEFLQCNLNALEAAFIPDIVKQKLKAKLLNFQIAD